MMPMDATDALALADLDAIAQAGLVASGELSATELLEAAIARLEAARGLNAVIADLFDRGRQQAAALDASGELRSGGPGPLAGIPFLLKDLGASLAGAPEAMGSRALRTHVATESAWIVDRYLTAGLVVFGKTNTPEWGNHCTTEPSLFGRTVNPWSPSITPGGSSGGRPRRWRLASFPRPRAVTAPVRSGCPPRVVGSSVSSHAAAVPPSRRRRSWTGGPGQRARPHPHRPRQRRTARRRRRVGSW